MNLHQKRKSEMTAIKNKYEWLREFYMEEVTVMMQRIIIRNADNIDKLKACLTNLDNEFLTLIKNRKYLSFNTNVVKDTYSRIMQDGFLRDFYFDLHAALANRLLLEFGAQEYQEMLLSIWSSYSTPFFTESKLIGVKALVMPDDETRRIKGELEIQPIINDFLSNNAWYAGVLVCSDIAHDLIEAKARLITVQAQ